MMDVVDNKFSKIVCSGLFSNALPIWTDIVVAPPFVSIDQVKSSLTERIEISAQNSWVGKGGAFTGEIRSVFVEQLGFSYL